MSAPSWDEHCIQVRGCGSALSVLFVTVEVMAVPISFQLGRALCAGKGSLGTEKAF
jgi:hypothetical protein